MKQFFISINSSLRLSLLDFGGKGEPVIFCHFTGGCGRLWQSTIHPLKEEFHCFAYDARGHGNSSKPLDFKHYDWNIHLSDLITVIEYIKTKTKKNRIFGVGHSFGSACLSQAIIETSKYFNWEKIVLVEPILGPKTYDFRKEKMSEIAKKRQGIFLSEEEIERVLRVKPPYKNWEKKSWEIYKKHGFALNSDGKYCLKCTPEIESYQYLYGNPVGWFEKLHKINLPVLLVYGENSELLPLSIYQMNQIKGSYLIKVPVTGHFIPQENPLLFSKIVKKWFSKT